MKFLQLLILTAALSWASAPFGSAPLSETSDVSAASTHRSKDPRPNILLIITDQQHAGMMSCVGNSDLETPAMDALARGGIRFINAYVTNPVCRPSRISLATGRMPGNFGMFHNAMTPAVPAEAVADSLGPLIKRAGYDTFYGGKADMGKALAPPAAGYDRYLVNPREKLPAACIAFIEKQRDRPFFAVASFINPHDICYFHGAASKTLSPKSPEIKPFFERASKLPLDRLPPLPSNFQIQEGEPPGVGAGLNTNAKTPSRTMRETYDERTWRMYRWIYCRLTEQVDGHIGKILGALKRSGLEEQTLIVFTSDHGDMAASHHLPSKAHFYEESAKVPFLMKYKGTIPERVVDGRHLVSSGLDLLPTLCDYAGANLPEGLLGRSLRSIAEGKNTRDHRPYVVTENSTGRMLRTANFKYCVFVRGNKRESLVDMRSDPGEVKNLAGMPEHLEVLNEHRSLLGQWIEVAGDTEASTFAIAADW